MAQDREVTRPDRLLDSNEAQTWHRRVLWLIGGLLLFRLIYVFFVPLDLVHDEAYYWDWSRQLDYGYYSKPPMVAWLIAISTKLGGASAPIVRLPAVMLGTLSVYFIYLLATRIYDSKVGFVSALLAALTPGNAALGLLMTIDAPLAFCWGLALYAIWRFLEDEPDRARWIAVACLATGLGLLTKQTMVAALGGTAIFLLFSHRDRRQLLRPGLVVWALGSLAFLLPVLWWNSQHGWVTAEHTGHHFALDSAGVGKRLLRSGEFLLGQLGVVSPVTWILVVTVIIAAFAAFPRLSRRELFLFCFGGLPFVAVLGLTLVRRVEPNWPAMFYPTSIILMTAWALGRIELPTLLPRASALPRAYRSGLVFVVATYLTPFLFLAFDLQRYGLDPTIRLRGWNQLGSQVSQEFSQLPRPDRTLLVVTTGRAVASELAFYMEQQPRVYLWNETPRVVSQYDLWQGPAGKRGWDAAILTSKDAEVPPRLAAAFDRIESVGQVEVPVSGNRSHALHLWRGVKLSHWPKASWRIAAADGNQHR